MKLEHIKNEVRKYLGYKQNKISFYTDLIILCLIFLTSLIYIIETYPLHKTVNILIHFIDLIIMSIFTIEFFLRVWVVKDRKAHFKSIYTWIDFLAIFPFLFGLKNLQFLRIFRFFRLFRYSEKYLSLSSKLLGEDAIEKFFVIRLLFTIFAILYVSTSLIYTFEKPYNVGINTFDDALYFTLVTVTTVGFGDITPITKIGKIVTMLVIICGIIIIPWHIGSLMKYIVYNSQKKKVICKNCGLKFHDPDATHCKACGKEIYQEYEGVSKF